MITRLLNFLLGVTGSDFAMISSKPKRDIIQEAFELGWNGGLAYAAEELKKYDRAGDRPTWFRAVAVVESVKLNTVRDRAEQ